MARNLKTGWVIIATSGSTVDGREIKKEWLQDIAKHYSEKVYCAQIWPNHERYFGAQGKVLAAKIENATEEGLKGEIHLMGILAPSEDLVYANKRGKLIYSSIEVLKNFANKGHFYLGGLAVTDTPASLGTNELQFSDDADSDKFYFNGSTVDLTGAKHEPEKTFFSFLRKPSTDDQEQEYMSKELLEKIAEGQNKMVEAFTAMGEQLKTLKVAPEEKPKDKPKDKPEGEDFVSKKDYDDLSQKFTALEGKFDEMKKTPVKGTQGDENLGDVEAEI